MAITGRVLLMDIGTTETKIVEANIGNAEVKILKLIEMRDMTPFLNSNGVLANFEGFFESLQQTLQEHKVKTKRLVVTGTCISTVSRVIAKEVTEGTGAKGLKALDEEFRDPARNTLVNNSTFADYQLYGIAVTETSKHFQQATGRIDRSFVQNFMEVCKDKGFNLLSIDTNMTAMANLSCMYTATFDVPSLIICDVGTTANYITFKDSALSVYAETSIALSGLVSALSDRLGISEIQARKLLYTVGCLQGESQRTELTNNNIPPSQYFEVIDDTLQESIKQLETLVASQKTGRNIGNVQLVLCGGIFAILGLYERLETIWTDTPVSNISLENVWTSKAMRFTHRLSNDVSSKFAMCIGLALKNQSKKAINLLPSEYKTVDTSTTVVGFTKLMASCAVLLMAAVVGIGAFVGINIYLNQDAPTKLSEQQRLLSAAESKNKKYQNYMDAMQNADSTVEPLMRLLANYPAHTLQIASIDSENFIRTGEIQPVDSEGEVQAVDSEVVAEEVSESEMNDVKQNLIIRGYSLEEKAVTDLYNVIISQEYVQDATITGVNLVSLPSRELMYIFEIRVVR